MSSSHGRDSGFNPSSPQSSSAKGDSYKHDGTPDTRFTTFSPEGEGSVRSTKYFNTLVSASDPQPNRFPGKPSTGVFHPTPGSQHTDKDPFITTHSSFNTTRDQRLSATASDFQPFSLTSVITNNGASGLTSDLNNLLGPRHHGFPQNADCFSSEKGLSRYIVVETRPHGEDLQEGHSHNFFKLLRSKGLSIKGKYWVSCYNGKLYFRFSNILDAWLIQHNAHLGGSNWQAANIRPDVWQLLNPNHTGDLLHEGRVILVVVIGPDCAQSTDQVEQTVRNMLNQQAEIFCFLKQNSSTDGSLKILIEFCDVDSAAVIVSKFHNFSVDGITLYLTLDKDGGAQPQPTPPAPRMPDAGMGVHTRRPSGPDLSSLFHDMTLTTHPAQQPQGSMIASSSSASGQLGMPLAPMGMYPPPMGYGNQLALMQPHYMLDQFQSRGPSPYHIGAGMPPFSQPYPFSPPSSTTTLVPYHAPYQHDYIPRAVAYRNQGSGRRENAMRVSRAPFYNAAGHHNHVDINRIRDGVDVRSTIMLRNIPNKVDQGMLKDIIDQSSWGKYDFMYLRIDFANDCNVGYAFINFVDPLDIIDFVRARGNQRWNCFKSDKVAEISYATIQGKDCLVSKFRNSSVMLEPPHYRPKLYYTTNGPHPELAGNEEPFPGPDNQSKMKRSVENAEHVGLFTPNAGAHIRDEQRRRRSQFDRGTRHAALEEFENYHYYLGQQ